MYFSPHALLFLVSPAASGAVWPRDPLSCVPAPHTLTPPVASSPVSSHPRWPRALPVPTGALPWHLPSPRTHPPALLAPQLPVQCSGYPLTARSKELGWALRRRGRPSSSRGSLQGEPRGVAMQGTVPYQQTSAGRLSPRAKGALRRNNEIRNEFTHTPLPKEILSKENQGGASKASVPLSHVPWSLRRTGVEANKKSPCTFSLGMMGICALCWYLPLFAYAGSGKVMWLRVRQSGAGRSPFRVHTLVINDPTEHSGHPRAPRCP